MAFLPLLLGIFTGISSLSSVLAHTGQSSRTLCSPTSRDRHFLRHPDPLGMATGLGMPLPHLLPHLSPGVPGGASSEFRSESTIDKLP